MSTVLEEGFKHSDITLSNGGLSAEVTGLTSGWKGVQSTFIPTGSKFYCEFKIDKGLISETVISVGDSLTGHNNDFGKLFKPATFSSAVSNKAPRVFLSSTEDWPEQGVAIISDSANDLDYFYWHTKGTSLLNPSIAQYQIGGTGPQYDAAQTVASHNTNAKVIPLWCSGVPDGSHSTAESIDISTFAYTSNGFLLAPSSGSIKVAPPIQNSVGDYVALGSVWPGIDAEYAWGEYFSEGDTVSVAVDTTRGWAWFARNGVWQKNGSPATLSNPATTALGENVDLALCLHLKTFGNKATANFGATPFTYTPPSGFSGVDANISNFRISGKVERLNSGVSRTIFLIDRNTKEVVQKKSSDPGTGNYSFTNVRGDRKYLLIALPQTSETNMNAIAIDHVVPAPI